MQDPSFDLGALIHSVALESRDAAAEAVKDHVDALLKKFLRVPDPEALAMKVGGGGDDGSIDVGDGVPAAKASGGDDQGGGGASS